MILSNTNTVASSLGPPAYLYFPVYIAGTISGIVGTIDDSGFHSLAATGKEGSYEAGALFLNNDASTNEIALDATLTYPSLEYLAAGVTGILSFDGTTFNFDRGVKVAQSGQNGQRCFFQASVSTTDATVTTIYTFVPTSGKMTRVVADVIGNATGANFSITRIAAFKSVGGVVTQIGAVASIGGTTESGAPAATIDTDGTNVRVRVTGIAATNYSWNAHINIFT